MCTNLKLIRYCHTANSKVVLKDLMWLLVAETMMIEMVLILSILGSYVVVMSEEVSLTSGATIPPGYALQDYLCSGPLKSNTTVVLDDGEHCISSGPPCNIWYEGNIKIKGSSMKTPQFVVREKGECYDSVQYKSTPWRE